MKDRLFISFSGGETSAFMAQYIIKQNIYKETVTAFANTGEENEKTLEFVERCNEEFKLNCVWVEAVVHHAEKMSPTHKIVNFETAARRGEPFEEIIKKYGIPNAARPHCTRALKVYPLTSYLRSIGWEANSYDTAIGIRADEIDRMNPKAKEKNIIYPMVKLSMTKPDVNWYWKNMPFRLGLKGYEGNCKWCWKKTLRKRLTIMKEHPEHFDFPERMEALYPHNGAGTTGEANVFFRDNISTKQLKEISAQTKNLIKAEDDSINYGMGKLDLDLSGGCSESCDVHHDSFDDAGKEIVLE